MKNILFLFLLLTIQISAQISEGQPVPETPLEIALNQYSHLCISSVDEYIHYQPESHLKLGHMGSDNIEYIFTEELDHFGINLTPLGISNSANLKVELTLDQQVFGFEFNGYQELKDLTGAIIEGSSVAGEKESIILGVDDGRIVLEMDGKLIYSEELTASTRDAKVRLTSLNATDECFWFFLDANYRRPVNYVNFVDELLFVEEGKSLEARIDLTRINNIEDALVRINLVSSPTPHFDQYISQQVEIPFGFSGPFNFTLNTDVANLVRDENFVYQFEIEVISGAHISVGDKSVLTVRVTDDITPYNTYLAPSDLMFTGFETDIGNGEDQIIFTNMVPFNPGTSFQLTNANYFADSDRFQLQGFRNGFSSIRFNYEGSNALDPGTTFCVFTGENSQLPGTFIDRIEVNGVDQTANFDIESVGIQDKSIETNGENSKSLFLIQGEWNFSGASGTLLGNVLSGIHIGGLWSVDQNPSPTFSNEHPDLECIGIQGPTTPGNHWGYYSCESPYEISKFDFKENLANFSLWTSGTDAPNINSLPSDICAGSCIITNDFIPLAWVDYPIDLTVECGSIDLNGQISQWLSNLGGGTYEGSCTGITPYNDFIAVNETGCGEYEVLFTVIAPDCNESIEAVARIHVIDNIPPSFSNLDPSITINCSIVQSWDQSNVSDNCTPDGDLEVTIDETLVSSNSTSDTYEVTYSVVDNCGNSSLFIQSKTVLKSSLSVDIIGGDNQVFCKDINSSTNSYSFGTTLLCQVQGNQGDISYSWEYYTADNTLLYTSSESTLSLNDRDRPTGRVVLTVSDGNCTASDEINVFASAFNLGESNIDLDVCPGASLSLIPTPFDAMGEVSYKWYEGSTTTLLSEEDVFIWESGGPYTTRLVATDGNGCVAQQYWQVSTLEFELAFNEDNRYCEGDNVLLSVDLLGDFGNNVDYKWYKGLEIISEESTTYEFVYETTTFKVDVTDNLTGCVTSGNYTIVIGDPKIIEEEEQFFCGATANVEFSPTIQGGQAPYQFTWLRKNPPNSFYTNISNTLNLVQSNLDITTPREFKFRVEDDLGCRDEIEIVVSRVNDLEVDVTLDGTPIADESTSSIIDCQSFILDAAAVGGYGDYIYSWLDENGMQLYTSSTIVHELSKSSSLTLIVTSDADCVVSKTFFFEGSGIDVLLGTASQTEHFSACIGTEVTLFNTISIDESLVQSYMWKESGVLVQGATSSEYTFLVREDGVRIELIITDIYGCTYKDLITITGVGCLESQSVAKRTNNTEQATSSNLILYPNPAKSYFHMEFNSEVYIEATMDLFTMSGELVATKNLHLKEGRNLFEISTKDLFSGMYLVRLRSGEVEYTEKLIIINN